MDWFEKVTGFVETTYEKTRSRLSVEDGRLVRDDDWREGRAVGSFSMPSLAELREETSSIAPSGHLRLSIVKGDVREMHGHPINRGALFQVASQFNMLEMVGPGVTPEDGVTGYQHDRTQGPACATAAGAATIWRNYLVPVEGGTGQTEDHQLDGLRDMAAGLGRGIGQDVDAFLRMANGYALPTEEGLQAIAAYLGQADEGTLDHLRGLLRLGLVTDAEVTDVPSPGPLVSQIFCSAMPVSYSQVKGDVWAPLARLVLEAAYEATLLAGLLSASRGGSNRILLTRLGGGAFGNRSEWIDDAMLRALKLCAKHDLNVVVVSYSEPEPGLVSLVDEFAFWAE